MPYSYDRRTATELPEEDRSAHPTVVEYAAREMLKGKTPATAAKTTAGKLGGAFNMMLGPVIPRIDPKKLEEALWDRMVDLVVENFKRVKPGKEDFALGMVVDHFGQKPAVEKTLRTKVIQKLHRDPFAAS